jgi:hypothetical protein
LLLTGNIGSLCEQQPLKALRAPGGPIPQYKNIILLCYIIFWLRGFALLHAVQGNCRPGTPARFARSSQLTALRAPCGPIPQCDMLLLHYIALALSW